MSYSNSYNQLPTETQTLKNNNKRLVSYTNQLAECYGEKITILQSLLSEQRSKVTSLDSTVKQLQADVRQKQSDISQHQVQIQKLLDIIGQLQAFIQQKNTHNEQLSRQNSALRKEGDELQMKLYARGFQVEVLREDARQARSTEEETTVDSDNSECKVLKDILNHDKQQSKVL